MVELRYIVDKLTFGFHFLGWRKLNNSVIFVKNQLKKNKIGYLDTFLVIFQKL